MAEPGTTRRSFLVKLAQGASLAGSGGFLWGFLVHNQARATPFALRPPGALPEHDFNAQCIKCGQCVNACPYDTLVLARAEDPIPIGTPYFLPRDIPCYMCLNIPCMKACPTGSLSPELKNINDSRMGLAVIDIENCLSWQGLRCEICYRVCPLKDKAISVENHPRRISKHAMFVPLVHSDACTGCGQCEKACPTEKAVIRVVEAKLVQGRIGDHYRLGWKHEDAITQEFKPTPSPAGPGAGKQEIPPKKAPGMDYLNTGDL
jgi:ferredoxin-type protein NapG